MVKKTLIFATATLGIITTMGLALAGVGTSNFHQAFTTPDIPNFTNFGTSKITDPGTTGTSTAYDALGDFYYVTDQTGGDDTATILVIGVRQSTGTYNYEAYTKNQIAAGTNVASNDFSGIAVSSNGERIVMSVAFSGTSAGGYFIGTRTSLTDRFAFTSGFGAQLPTNSRAAAISSDGEAIAFAIDDGVTENSAVAFAVGIYNSTTQSYVATPYQFGTGSNAELTSRVGTSIAFGGTDGDEIAISFANITGGSFGNDVGGLFTGVKNPDYDPTDPGSILPYTVTNQNTAISSIGVQGRSVAFNSDGTLLAYGSISETDNGGGNIGVSPVNENDSLDFRLVTTTSGTNVRSAAFTSSNNLIFGAYNISADNGLDPGLNIAKTATDFSLSNPTYQSPINYNTTNSNLLSDDVLGVAVSSLDNTIGLVTNASSPVADSGAFSTLTINSLSAAIGNSGLTFVRRPNGSNGQVTYNLNTFGVNFVPTLSAILATTGNNSASYFKFGITTLANSNPTNLVARYFTTDGRTVTDSVTYPDTNSTNTITIPQSGFTLATGASINNNEQGFNAGQTYTIAISFVPDGDATNSIPIYATNFSPPANPQNNGNGGLSRGARIGLGVGLAVGIPFVLLIIIGSFVGLRKAGRRKR